MVGQYEEEREDESAAYSWYKKGCDNSPVSDVYSTCLNAVDAKLKSNDIAVATALFMKVCSDDPDGKCEGGILGRCQKKSCFDLPATANLYIEMLTQACDGGHKVSCKILPKFEKERTSNYKPERRS